MSNYPFLAKLQKRRQEGNYRKLQIVSPQCIDFASNDYYGLSNRQISRAVKTGATGSRLISGNSKKHEKLEHFLADFHQSEKALLFGSGYLANTGLLSAVADRNTYIIADEYIHASLKDGILLSKAHHFKFKHNDVEDLSRKLDKVPKGHFTIVVIETVYSMSGDFAPLQEIVELKQKYDFEIVADEAHAVGIFGNGKGRVVEENLQKDVFARVVTFGKAIGSMGAAVLAGKPLIEYLINFSRPFIYTTALPEIIVSSIFENYQKIIDNRLFDVVFDKIEYFKKAMKNRTFSKYLLPGNSPIQILLPVNTDVKQLEEIALSKNLFIKSVKHPTVPKGEERIRITLHHFNTHEEINSLINFLNNHLK